MLPTIVTVPEVKVEHAHQFFTVLCAGFGLFLVGVVNLLLGSRSLGLRLLATVFVLLVAVCAAVAIDVPGVATRTLLLLAITLIPVFLLSSGHFLAAVGIAFQKFNRPTIRFGLVTVAGISVAVGSTIIFQCADEEVLQRGLGELVTLETQVSSVECKRARAFTDRGTAIALKKAATTCDAMA